MQSTIPVPSTDYVSAPIVLPPDFVEVPVPLPMHLARSLGYCGGARFVMFYYEPSGEEILWRDGRSYGFGTGGWLCFIDQIAPLAEACGLNLGGPTVRAVHALIFDRLLRQAYFADRDSAIRFLTQQGARRAELQH